MEFNRLVYGYHCVTGWEWRVPKGTHEGYTLWSVWGGKGTMILGDNLFELSAGDMFFIDYSKNIDAKQDCGHPLQVQFIDFTLNETKDFSAFPEHKHYHNTFFIGELFKRFRLAQEENDEVSKCTWFYSLLDEYKSRISPLKVGLYSENIDIICERFRQFPDKKYDIRQLARELGVTEDHFIRLFKAEHRSSPYAYLLNIRLDTAKTLLSNSNFNITQIAEKCGFADVYHFSRFFKLKTGISPVNYRK